MDNENELNSIKYKMIETFYNETERIFREYFKRQNINQFNRQINRYFNAWKYCRIDITHQDKTQSIKISGSDSEIKIKYPEWLNNGKGTVIESENKTFKFNIECNSESSLVFALRGIDFRNNPRERIPIYVTYKQFTYNDSLIFKENHTVWHDQYYNYVAEGKKNDKIKVSITFETIFDYFPKLKEFQNKINYEFNTLESIEHIFNQFEDYIIEQKIELVKFIENQELYQDYLILNKKFNKLTNDFNTYKNNTEKVLDTYNLFFNSLFKFNKPEPIQLVKYSRELNNQLLDFIDNICRKYELKWWMDFGLLLGAVRHKGLIPWDDDYDISMLRTDYDKFFKIIHQEIKENNLSKYIQVHLTKKGPNNSLLMFIKFEFFDKGRLFGFIDIFPHDYITKEIDDIEHAQTIFYNEHYKLMEDLKNGVDRNTTLNEYYKLFNVSESKTDKLIAGIEFFNYNQNDYDTIFPLKKIRFEDRYYPCPNKPKEFLKHLYGETYYQVPKSAYNHGFYDALMRYDDVFEVFEEHIARLREVNEKLSKD